MSCCSRSFTLLSRVSLASSSTARAWRTMEVCSGSIFSSFPAGDRPSRARACCSAASACSIRSLKSVWSSRASGWPWRIRVPRSMSMDSTRPATLALRVTWSSAARVPVAATVRGRARSAAGTTRTSRAGEPAAGACGFDFSWEAALAGNSPRHADSPRARARIPIKGRTDIRLMINRCRAASPTKMQSAATNSRTSSKKSVGLPGKAVDPALEDLHQHEEDDADRAGLAPGLAQPLQAGPP